jgi:hypothetical protein
MFEAMLNSVAAKEEAIDEFAQLNRYHQKICGAHGLNAVVAPTIVSAAETCGSLVLRNPSDAKEAATDKRKSISEAGSRTQTSGSAA